MCGLSGLFRPTGPRPGAEAAVRAMVARQAHRGPDEQGLATCHGAGAMAVLGHNRLSIVALSTGQQPLTSEDGQVQLIVNGEIYNHLALRRQLEAAGHRFATGSDCETLVHLYEERGLDLLDDVVGMFAFALWDGRRGRLVLGRDRMGQKPLYYCTADGETRFASELAALRTTLTAPRIDPNALRLYLTLQYVPAPATILEGVRALPPAHLAVFEGGRERLVRYWSLDDPAPRHSGEPVRHALRRAFDEAVRLRLMSEVPLGAFLSGGIDSTLVVASMARALARPVRTFAIGFEDAAFDERPWAEQVARHFGCQHTVEVVRPDAARILPQLVRHYGEPFADSSAVPTWYLSQMTRRHVTVALSGDAGDELFAGYERYLAARLAGVYDRLHIGGLARRMAAGWERVGAPASHVRNRWRRLKRFLDRLDGEALPRYLGWIAIFDRDAVDRLLAPDLAGAGWDALAHLADVSRGGPSLACDPVAALCRLDLLTYLPGDLLVKVDRASMAHSLEVRAPFLDHRLVALASQLSGPRRMRGWRLKALLKQSFAARLPPGIAARRKQGFGVPVTRWLRTDLVEMTSDLLLSPGSRLRGVCRPAEVARLVDEHRRCQADHGARLWALLVLELWCREVLEDTGVSGTAAA